MLWIVGGSVLAGQLATLTEWSWLTWLAGQMHHAPWIGFTFYDLIFPLFLFIAGVAMPFSLTRRAEDGVDKKKLMLHVVRSGLILVVLGIIYNNGLFRMSFAETQ